MRAGWASIRWRCSARRARAHSSSCSRAATARFAAMAIRWRARRLAGQSSTDTLRKDLTKLRTIPRTFTGIRPGAPTRFFRRSTGKQRAAALLGDPREEKGTATIALKKPGEPVPGLPVSDMTRDQRELVDQVLADLLLPFRKKDADEA